jgi:calcineurin-like phosphoesterase
MIGDVVGESGLKVLEERLPSLIKEHDAAFVTVNGENAAGGFGLTRESLDRIFSAGADVVTGGNHIWEKRDFWHVLNTENRVLRPENYPKGAAGRGFIRMEKGGVFYLVINLQGRELMPAIDCPFKTFDAVQEKQWGTVSDLHPLLDMDGNFPGASGGPARNCKALVLVDFHAESARENEALGYYLDGRASVVAGTHTHVQTADERLLPGGTAYITDLGMTGARDGVIGMDKKICLDRARNHVLYRLECAEGPGSLQGVVAGLDGENGKALFINRLG